MESTEFYKKTKHRDSVFFRGKKRFIFFIQVVKQDGKKVMYYRQLITAVLLLAMIFILGCGPKRPKEMPKTYPCKIKLTKDGNPVSGVGITLISNNSAYGSLAVGGTTETDGVAKITTYYSTYGDKGAPSGEFQVTVIEVPAIPKEVLVTPDELSKMTGPEREGAIAKMDAARRNVQRVVPFSFAVPDSTPLKVTVAESKQGTEVSFEINDYK